VLPWRIDMLGSPPPEPTTAGLDRSLWELGAGLVRRGHRVRVLFPTPTPAVPPPYRGVEGVPVPLLPAARRPVPQAVEIGRATGDCIAADTTILVGTDERAGAVRLAGRGARPTWALYLNAVPSERPPSPGPDGSGRGLRDRLGGWLDQRTLRRLEAEAIRRASVVLVGSAATRERLVQRYRLPDSKLAVLPPPVPEPDPSETREEARMALRIPPDVPVAVFIGRRPDRQGLPIALEAFRRSRVFFPGARLLVVGSSPRPDPGVIPLGVADEATKVRALRAADLFLLPSLDGGPAYAVAEAMRYGLAVVVSARVRVEGAEAGRAFRAVPSDDPGDYAAEFAELFADPALRRRIGDEGRRYADQFGGIPSAERFEQALAGSMGH
jgi:glycosyltransferase involved in cell wall biosynthesis